MGTIGQRVRELRKGKGLTQPQLAKQIGIDQSTLSDIERGAGFSADTLMGLAKALVVSADHLMAGRDSLVWPFSEDLHGLVSGLSAEELAKLENVMRAHLGQPPAPAATPAPAAEPDRSYRQPLTVPKKRATRNAA